MEAGPRCRAEACGLVVGIGAEDLLDAEAWLAGPVPKGMTLGLALPGELGGQSLAFDLGEMPPGRQRSERELRVLGVLGEGARGHVAQIAWHSIETWTRSGAAIARRVALTPLCRFVRPAEAVALPCGASARDRAAGYLDQRSGRHVAEVARHFTMDGRGTRSPSLSDAPSDPVQPAGRARRDSRRTSPWRYSRNSRAPTPGGSASSPISTSDRTQASWAAVRPASLQAAGTRASSTR